MKTPLIKNSDGKPSASVTFAWIAFIYCLIAITFGLIEEIKIADKVFKFRMLGSDIVIALIGPAFALYGYRRRTEKLPPEDLRK